MTAEQVSGVFDAGEGFIEGTIAAALVAFWLIVLALYLAQPYMAGNLHKFTLRLGADLWWILYVALRDLLLISTFLGSFIFFYPDVVSGNELPITGGLAAVCAFAVLVVKLIKSDSDLPWFRVQILLLGLGGALYIVPYMLGVQVTQIGTDTSNQLASVFVSNQNPDVALVLCYLSSFLVGILGLAAVAYNLRLTSRPSRASQTKEQTR